jgi:hypothetical protein
MLFGAVDEVRFMHTKAIPSRRPALLDLRQRSLARANTLVWLSVILAFFLSDFPHNRATLLLLIPTAGVFFGTCETMRCIRKRWSFYHAGVLLCIYMDLMAISMILFLLIYPYTRFISSSS